MIMMLRIVLVLTMRLICHVSTSNITFELQLLDEMLQKPLTGWSLVFYAEPDLDLEPLLTLPTFQDVPRVLVDLKGHGGNWSENQSPEILRGKKFIHIVLFQNSPELFFETVSLQWNPTYLLLFNLARKSSQTLLLNESYKGITNLVLVETLTPTTDIAKSVTGIYTSFPFSDEKPIQFVKEWDPKTIVTLQDIFIDRFPTFEGYEFQLGTWFDDFPYLHQSKTAPEGVGDGVEVEMLDAMGKSLDFKYNLTTEPPDDKWGAFENGSWTGMLGMVHRKDKNFTVNYFVITGERVAAFDASVSYWMEGFGMSMLAPPPLPKWRGAYYPFMPFVWLCFVVIFIFIVLVMILQDNVQLVPFFSGDMVRAWAYLLRSVLNQSLPSLPKAQWQRLFIGFWMLYCFIITTAYTANLIAFLTIPVFPRRIQTVQELAESDYRLSMFDYGEFVPGALRTSKDPYYRTLGEKLELFPDYDQSVFSMLAGTHAYVESYSYNRILIFVDYEADNSYMLEDQLYPGHLCWYFQKNTAWKHKFDIAIQRLVEAGLIAHWLKVKNEDFLGRDFKRRQELASKEAINTALTLEHLQGVFFILLFSWAIGGWVFISEILFHRLCVSTAL